MHKTYLFETIIKQPVETVYQIFLDPTMYPKWNTSWGAVQYVRGTWEVGQHLTFIDDQKGGTKVVVNSLIPNQLIETEHIAMVDRHHQEIELTDDMMRAWIGTQEIYSFASISEGTCLFRVTMMMDEAFAQMIHEGWSQAIQDFKALCEQ